eukprot:Skav203727  [mRNA]  locus=scaffold2895:10693:21856:- [translate_table: standard]
MAQAPIFHFSNPCRLVSLKLLKVSARCCRPQMTAFPDAAGLICLAGESDYINGVLTAVAIFAVIVGLGLAVKLYLQQQKSDKRSSAPVQRSLESQGPAETLGRSRDVESEPPLPAPVAPPPKPQQPRETKVSKALEAFRKLDRDDNGFITRSELQSVLDHLPHNIADAVFRACDKDGDGRISFQEFEDKFYPMINPTDARPQIDWEGSWLMEWPNGDHFVSTIVCGRFNAVHLHQVFHLQTEYDPLQFVWQDGTVQQLVLESSEARKVKWKLDKKRSKGQFLHWVRIPYCGINRAHTMELAKEKCDYVCKQCKMSRSNEWFWRCSSCVFSLCPDCAEVPPEPEHVVFGISASYVLGNFPDLAQLATKEENPNFYRMADVLAKGERGLGYQKICPRDGKPGCSIVDAVDERHRGPVTHFVSWCWQYTLSDFVSAIGAWVREEGVNPNDVYLWVCFFCNNQYRILEAKTQTGSDELKTVFESHLSEAGRMLLLLDSFVNPVYIKRAWCIFEAYVCIDNNFPMTIILPERAESEFDRVLDTKGGIRQLQTHFEALNVRDAEASNKKDEEMIKFLICDKIGFVQLNETVKSRLSGWLSEQFRNKVAVESSPKPGRDPSSADIDDSDSSSDGGSDEEAEVPFWHDEPIEIESSGRCQVEGPCLSSPDYPNETNHFSNCEAQVGYLPHFPVIRVTNFSTNGRLTINGYTYTGSGMGLIGTSLVLRSNISWQAHYYYTPRDRELHIKNAGWRICVEKPVSCTDGLALIPVSIPDCPPSADPLPDCQTAEPGQLCEGDGACGTREDINNCYDPFHTYPPTRDVYRKSTGTTTTVTRTTTTTTTMLTLTRTSTTSTTTPLVFRTTSGDQKWTVAGPCQVKGGCLESPNYPGSYGSNESCAASLPAFSVITMDEFNTEKYFDYLSVNGYWYSGFGLKGSSTALWSNLSWSSDGWNAANQTHGELRWRICVEKPVSCTDGLALIPVSIPDCPPSADPLPDCQTAEPGQLCEGDGACGTREDINNCYDPFHTYPPTRDVYRKSTGGEMRWCVEIGDTMLAVKEVNLFKLETATEA